MRQPSANDVEEVDSRLKSQGPLDASESCGSRALSLLTRAGDPKDVEVIAPKDVEVISDVEMTGADDNPEIVEVTFRSKFNTGPFSYLLK